LYAPLLAEYASFMQDLQSESNGLSEAVVFSAPAQKMAPYMWCKCYMAKYGPFGIETARLASIEWPASVAEHSWSIGAWFHSKKRNRLSQTNAGRFVRVHTILSLEAALDGNSPMKILAWGLKMTIGEEAEEETVLAGGAAAAGGGGE
jgi:hypothetical protein